MDRLNQGEKVAAAAGIVLLISMWLPWYDITIHGIKLPGIDNTVNAWQAFSLIDIFLLITAIAAIGAAVLAANEGDSGLPVAASSVVTALGALAVLLIIFRLIDSPAPNDLPDQIDIGRKIGIFIGLVAAAAVTYGGYLGMQEEGTSLSREADKLR
jgi:hypothetical protein